MSILSRTVTVDISMWVIIQTISFFLKEKVLDGNALNAAHALNTELALILIAWARLSITIIPVALACVIYTNVCLHLLLLHCIFKVVIGSLLNTRSILDIWELVIVISKWISWIPATKLSILLGIKQSLEHIRVPLMVDFYVHGAVYQMTNTLSNLCDSITKELVHSSSSVIEIAYQTCWIFAKTLPKSCLQILSVHVFIP